MRIPKLQIPDGPEAPIFERYWKATASLVLNLRDTFDRRVTDFDPDRIGTAVLSTRFLFAAKSEGFSAKGGCAFGAEPPSPGLSGRPEHDSRGG